MFGVLRMACPWGGDAHSAREPDAAVHDQQLAVRSVVHARQMRPMRRVKAPDLNARSGHLIDHRRVHPGTAQPVQQDVALHPASCGTGQRARKLLADGARPVDAGLEGDRVLCIVDGLEHRREDLVTVQQDFCRISVDERRAQQHPELAGELRIIECMESLHLPRDLCSVARDIQGVRCTGPGAVAQGFVRLLQSLTSTRAWSLADLITSAHCPGIAALQQFRLHCPSPRLNMRSMLHRNISCSTVCRPTSWSTA